MTGKSLLKQYQEIWNEFLNTEVNCTSVKSEDLLLKRGFTFQFDESLQDIDVLFVGINPSYDGIPKESNFYTKDQALGHKYFKPFENIKMKLESNYNRKIVYSHTDLLVFRETDQSFITNELYKSEAGLRFIMEQLKIAKKIVEYLNPKVIVVSNTQARTFIGADRIKKEGKPDENVWMDYEFKFDEELGTQKVVNNVDFNPYVFFTSMLSGQRALDNGSKERLVWHINKALKET